MKHFTAFEEYHLHPLVCGYVRLAATAKRWNHARSTAPYSRIYWNDKPGAFIRQDKKDIELDPDVIVIIPPNAVFATRHSARHAIQHFYIHCHTYPVLTDTNTAIIVRPVTEPVRLMISEIIKLMRKDAANKSRISLAIRGLIEWTFAGVCERSEQEFDARILKVMHYISEHIERPLSAEDLALHGGMGANALRFLFRVQVGLTPYAYIRAKRIEKAGLLLHTTDLSVEQIADQTGFYDRHHFTRVFKRMQGAGPAEFRSRNDNPFIEKQSGVFLSKGDSKS